MAAPSKFQKIEEEYGLPMEEILVGLYKECGSQTAVAKKLGVNQSTVSLWLLRCSLVEVKLVQYVYTPTEKAKELSNGA